MLIKELVSNEGVHEELELEEDEDSESSEESKWDWLEETDDKGYFCITTTEPIKKHE